jgi:hypothetical protein
MRVNKHLAAVVAAGTVAFSLVAAPLALASGSLLQSLAGQAGDAEAAQASDGDGLAAVQGLFAQAGEARSYWTAYLGPLEVQLPDGWELTATPLDDGAAYEYAADDVLFQLTLANESAVGSEDEATLAVLDSLTDGKALAALGSAADGSDEGDVTIEALPDRYLDGVLLRTALLSAADGDGQVSATCTIVFGDDYTASMTYAWRGGRDAACADYAEQGVAGLHFDETYYFDAAYDDDLDADYSYGGGQTGAVEPGEAFVVGDWQVSVDAAAEDLAWVTAPESFFLEDYAGAEMVAVPVTVTNVSDASADPFDLSVYTFNTYGRQQSDWPGIGFDDSIESVGSLLPGASATCYLYAAYTGDGTYTFEFTDWLTDADVTVAVPVVRP